MSFLSKSKLVSDHFCFFLDVCGFSQVGLMDSPVCFLLVGRFVFRYKICMRANGFITVTEIERVPEQTEPSTKLDLAHPD